MQVHDLARAFESLEAISSRLAITEQLAALFKDASPQEAQVIAYFSLGMLNPPYIGTQFSFAEKMIIPVIANMTEMTTARVTEEFKKVGDLGSVIAHYTWKPAKTMTVMELCKRLHDLEKIAGTGSQELKAKALEDLLYDVDPLMAKFIVRILCDTLRLGFSDMTLVDALSWMVYGNKSGRKIIEDAYNRCADIGYIAYVLKEVGIKELERLQVQVGIPIRPALAERLPTTKEVFEKLGRCVAQPKLDGFRLQVHLDNSHQKPEIHFFSRNLQDMSSMFPDLHHLVAALPVKSLICEGEAIGYDPETDRFLPFQETVKRKRKHGVEEAARDFPLKLFLFDILYLNGKELLNEPHEERRAQLLHIFSKGKIENLQVISERPINAAQELEEYFLEEISNGLEGLVVKKPDAPYQPGKRNFNWIKLKRVHAGTLEDTIDVVILGYYAGSGKRASFGIGAFLVGIYNKAKDCYQTIAKVGTGLSDAEWEELKKNCDKHAVKQQPKNVECPKELAPDVWTTPELVCVVLADEITQSPLHTAAKTETHLGFALRFPRFMGYRPDKRPEDATDTQEIRHLYKDQYAVAQKKGKNE